MSGFANPAFRLVNIGTNRRTFKPEVGNAWQHRRGVVP